jgi:two-component system, sensor histidine kinase and response regulator
MLEAMAMPSPQDVVFPAGYLASPADKRRATWVVGVSLLLFVAAAPFAKVPQGRFVPFIAIYEATLVFNDLVTAMLLFGIYKVYRNRAHLVLGWGYLFTASMAVTHAMTFPGLFSETGLLGAGHQSTAWLYMFWHAGFPVAVMAYTVLKSRPNPHGDLPFTRHPVLAGAIGVVLLTAVLTYVATGLEAHLPVIMYGDRYTGEMPLVVRTVWGLSLAALAFLWIRRPHTVLDVWLMVVMSAWLFDIALAAVVNQGRYDFGFYAGRIYGLVAVSLVLFVLLAENTKLHAQLVEMHAQAAAANRTKDLFLAMVGHELRNPLTSLQGGIHVLQRLAGNDPMAGDTKSLVDRQMRSLSRLVEDLVDVGRAARGKLHISRQRLDLGAAVEGTVQSLAAAGRFGEHRIEVKADRVWVHADPHRIEQIVANLLVNAVKYTPAGRAIEVAVRREAGRAVLTVCDEGIGMRPEVLARAFDWFYQANEALDGARGGLGVGLALVRELVKLHDGEVQGRSEEGKGTCFTVSLPALPA